MGWKAAGGHMMAAMAHTPRTFGLPILILRALYPSWCHDGADVFCDPCYGVLLCYHQIHLTFPPCISGP